MYGKPFSNPTCTVTVFTETVEKIKRFRQKLPKTLLGKMQRGLPSCTFRPSAMLSRPAVSDGFENEGVPPDKCGHVF
jgi:hypothetical protein